MTTTLSPERTVGELVAEQPGRSRVFEDLGIDYCCGGKRPLTEACTRKGLDPGDVLDRLRMADEAGEQQIVDAASMGLTELCDHIEETHHAYMRRELARLDQITAKVEKVHADREPRLHDLRQVFLGLNEEIQAHLLKEERVLFPYVRKMDASGAVPEFHCGTAANPIRQMEVEHDTAGEALERMRELTDQFTPPEWACNTYRALLSGLYDLEQDLHQHIHKENNVLFPRVLEQEAALTSR
jgi:regulator of cell morphogenesis and NO signaling